MKLIDMKPGEKGIIINVKSQGAVKRRLLDMGLVPGTGFKVIRSAPLGDPIEIQLKGFHLTLRKEEAAEIRVKYIGDVGDGVPIRNARELYSPVPREAHPENENSKIIHVALVGNPNSGKTSLFNALVGAHQKVGNFSGVTVESIEGKAEYNGYTLRIIDLPGTYSLTPYSPEELVTRQYIINEKPDIIVDVVDGTNLDRNLYLTTQLMELETDTLVALNMSDEMDKKEIRVRPKLLQRLLGSHIIPTSAARRTGLEKLKDHIVRVYRGNISIARNKLEYSLEVEEAVEELERTLPDSAEIFTGTSSRWIAIKLLEDDSEVIDQVKRHPNAKEILETSNTIKSRFHKTTLKEMDVAITEDRHSFIRGAVKETVSEPLKQKQTLTDKVDNIILNRFLGLPIFLIIMWLIFQGTFKLGEYPMGWLESLFSWLSSLIHNYLPNSVIKDILIEGVINGVGGVLVFVPNILILFLFISILEASGYMARASFVIDKVMHSIGLHGKSFIPMITGFGCSVPAFMACRTLKNPADRMTTMLIIPFVSCSAKIPIYILLIRSFFPVQYAGTILFIIYFFGIFIAALTAKILKLSIFKGESEPFVMELPSYRLPGLRSVLYQIWQKTQMYLKKAATIILVSSILIWAAGRFPENHNAEELFKAESIKLENSKYTPEEIQQKIKVLKIERNAAQLEYSLAGRLGKIIEPVIKPLGFDWKIGISLITGLTAKEVVVSTLSTIYAMGDESEGFSQLLRNDPVYNYPTVIALIIFVLLYTPCLAATVVFHKEAGKWKWTLFYIALTLGTAWIWAFISKWVTAAIVALM